MAVVALKVDKIPQQLICEADRNRLREYLTGRLRVLKREARKCGEQAEANFVEGGEMEVLFLFDELLGEQPPDPGLRKSRKAH
jgi:hypothetical protein